MQAQAVIFVSLATFNECNPHQAKGCLNIHRSWLLLPR